MSRIVVLSAFLTRNFFRVLLGAVPPILTLGLFQATFFWPGDTDYFAAIAGLDLALIALVTTLLFISCANRAATYPLVARLPRRVELLIALFIAALFVTSVMGVLLVALILGLHKSTATPLQMLVIIPRWLALVAFAIGLGLNLGGLVSRGVSQGLTALVVSVLLVVARLPSSMFGDHWVIRGMHVIVSPFTLTMISPVSVLPVVPWLCTLIYAVLLFALAAALLEHKDLLWAE